MCGRFTLTIDPASLQKMFEGFAFPSWYSARYNIAPSQPVLAIPNDAGQKADFFIWGLIPSWAKESSPTVGLINARAETLAEKPSFRGSLKYKRCLIPANGFYEWKAQPGLKAKQPYYIYRKDHEPLAFAGLWDEWHAKDGSVVRTCVIITTTPNELILPLHNRMPAILERHAFAAWLDPAPQPPQAVLPLLRPYPAELLQLHPVSPAVNNPANDRPECILAT